jgi:tetratricopeptide (TPR) repeat protein
MLALLAGSLTTAWQVSHRQQVRACTGAERKLIDVWDPARRAAVRSAFRKSGLPYAEVALATVERVFDGYARAWVAMHTDTCEATHVRGEQSAEMLDLRMSCLGDRLMQLKTLAETFSTADAKLVERATQSAQSLPGLEGCANTAALRAPIPPPRDVQTSHRVDEVRQQLAKANALGLAARYEEGRMLVDEALATTGKLGYAPLEAEAQLELGELYGERGEFPRAAQAFHRSFVAAIAGHHDDLAARASTELLQTVGVSQAHYEDGDRWAEVAEAWVNRLKHDDAIFGEVYTRRSILRKDEGRYDDALRDAQRALDAYLRVLKPDDYRIAESYQSLGNIHYQQGHFPQAIEAFQRSLTVWQQSVGPDHPKLIPSLVGLAGVYGDSGEHERAIVEYEHMLAMLRRVQADHPAIANIYNDMGNDLLAVGRDREAFEQFQRALEAWRKRLGPSRETVSAAGPGRMRAGARAQPLAVRPQPRRGRRSVPPQGAARRGARVFQPFGGGDREGGGAATHDPGRVAPRHRPDRAGASLPVGRAPAAGRWSARWPSARPSPATASSSPGCASPWQRRSGRRASARARSSWRPAHARATPGRARASAGPWPRSPIGWPTLAEGGSKRPISDKIKGDVPCAGQRAVERRARPGSNGR